MEEPEIGVPLETDVLQTNTSRSGALYGNGLSNTAFTTLKMAVFAPIPSARVKTATVVKPGLFTSIRNPKRAS
jgi:hypothetical protein